MIIGSDEFTIPLRISYKSLECAYTFYEKHIRMPVLHKLDAYRAVNVAINGAVSYRDWEVFSGLLVWDRGDGKVGGSDLTCHEVKSSKNCCYEYQYYPSGGVEKFHRDMKVNHVWIHYTNDYQDLTVRVAHSHEVQPIIAPWYNDILVNSNRKDFKVKEVRKTISLARSEKVGRLALWVKNGIRKDVGIEYKFTY
jgi:hypothetical protein